MNQKIKISKQALILGSAITYASILGCSREDSNPEPLPPYVGTWKITCSKANDKVKTALQMINIYEVRAYHFSGSETYSSLWRIYSTSNCDRDSLLLEVEYGEKFTIGEELDKSTGVKAIDLEVDGISGFMLTNNLVSHANSTNLCGGGWIESTIDWSEVHRKDISALQCLDEIAIVHSGQTIYSSFKIEDGILKIAASLANTDGSSEEKRMTQLFEKGFVKQ